MRVLLRKSESGCYYQETGDWVANPANALDFGSIHQALQWVGKVSPEEMELALAFDGLNLISAVSLAAARAEIAKSA